MRLLHLSSAAIIDKFYYNLFGTIDRYNHEQVAYIPYSEKEIDNDSVNMVKEYLQFTNTNLILAPIKNKMDRLLYFKKIRKYYKYLSKMIDISSIDVVHSHSLYTDGGLAYCINKKFNIPYVVAVRTTDTNIFMKNFFYLRVFGRKILDNASAIVFITPEIKKIATKYLFSNNIYPLYLEKKTHIIPNGVDSFWLENIYNVNRKLNDNRVKLVQVSRLQLRKNIDKSILAVKKIIDKGIECSLIIVGYGKDEKRLKTIVRDNNMESYVKFSGYIKDKEIILDIYRNNDIFIMPSISETFGISYVEAMTQGLPIVGLVGTGLYGCFDDMPVGSFALDDKPVNVYEAIIDVIIRYKEYSSNCIIQSKKYNWEIICDKYQEIYSTIGGKK